MKIKNKEIGKNNWNQKKNIKRRENKKRILIC